jgi:hypothetical protein
MIGIGNSLVYASTKMHDILYILTDYKVATIMSINAMRPTQSFTELPYQSEIDPNPVGSDLPTAAQYYAQSKQNIFCIEPNSTICRSSQNIQVPPNVFVFIGHGGQNKQGIVGFNIPRNAYFLNSDEFIDMVKLRMRVSGPVTEAVLVSCDIADVDNGAYAQRIADGLGIPVTVSTNIISLYTNGRVTTNLYEQNNNRRIVDGFGSLKKFFPKLPHYQVSGGCYYQHLKDCIPR